MSAGQQVWLHWTKYTDGPPNYWYAFAGNPDIAPARAWDAVAPTATLLIPPSGIAADASLRLALSEPVAGLDQSHWTLVDAAGQPVVATAELDSESNEVAIIPDAPLDLSGRYRLELRGGATDAAGNALIASSWELTTRVDEDPLTRELPIVLRAGPHRLVRFDDAWHVADEQVLDVTDERWLMAARRARMPGEPSRWLAIASGGLTGWWVVESAVAHAAGALDVASFEPVASVELPEGIHRLYRWESGAMQTDGEVSVRTTRTVALDRRAVVDGLLFVRAAPDESAIGGRWLGIDPAIAPDESFASRILRDETLEADASLALGLGTWTLFRFDERGTATERREVDGRSGAAELVIRRVLEVGETRFFVVSGGELDGWAVREDERHIVSIELETASAE
jgi:hypothetical protein